MHSLNGWLEPERLTQATLFPRDRKEFLARARIGEADLSRWHQAGWLSEEALDADPLDEPLICEIGFVQDLATCGLFTDDVDRLLLQLEKPYRYDPIRTAYSFKFGWVRMPLQLLHDDVDEFMQEHLEDWLMSVSFKDDGGEALSDVTMMLAKAKASLEQIRRVRSRVPSEDADES